MLDFPHSLDGFTVEAIPASRYTNLVVPMRHPQHGRWYMKVYVDALHPNVRMYDGASRELFAYRMSRSLGDLVPETYRFPGKRFAILVKDGGAPLTPGYISSLTGERRTRSTDQLARILVFSHWIGDIERALEHFVVDATGHIRSFDFQCAGPGAEGNERHLLWPWIREYTGKENVEVDDVRFMIHVGEYSDRRDEKPGVQRLIKTQLPELLTVEPYLPTIVALEQVTPDLITGAMEGLEFYQRGFEPYAKGVTINLLYREMLLARRNGLRRAFEKWTEWVASH
jgi:hypothetical protein